MADASQLEAKLAAIKASYQAQMPTIRTEIDDAWKLLRDQGWSLEQANSLYRLVHNMSGSGATFGFTEISEAARKLENQLQIYMDGIEKLPSNTRPFLEPLLLALYQEMDAAAKSSEV